MKEIDMKSIILIILIIFCSNSVYAEDNQAILSRMKSRLSDIIELKMQGIIGENNNGFLEFRGPNKNKESIVNAENADRLAIYRVLAEKNNISSEIVGRRRALQIAQKADNGEWLQDTDGNWYKKTTSYNNKVKPPEMPDDIYTKIRNKCERDWPDDFQMQKYCVEKQVESWQFLNK
jgi:uncharacterized protein YdbL (DUF1318 family)